MVDTPLFKIVEPVVEDDEHMFVRVQAVEPATLAEALAPRVKGVYFDEEATRDRLVEAAQGLKEFDGSEFTQDEIAEAVAEELDAVVPLAWGENKRPQQTDVQRSELGEIVAADVLRTLFSTIIPASRISTKEIPDQQTRGADVIGLEDITDEHLVLVLGEVKGSTAQATPPGAVYEMSTKLKELVGERRPLLQELIWLRDHASDEWAARCANTCGAFALGRKLFDVLLAPVLVRSAANEGDKDTGPFRSNPKAYGERIRFVTVVVEDDLYELAKSVYSIVREPAA